ncbi:PD-(D/E)XK nuclease family protein, partial [Gemmatimonadota bacterium]
HHHSERGLALGSIGRRSRFLPHRRPSSIEVKGRVLLPRILSLSGVGSREAGTVVHGWLETLEWMESWTPDWDDLHARVGRDAPGLSPGQLSDLQRELEGWLRAEEVRARLSREAYPGGGRVRVRNERPFAVRLDDTLFQGRMDRVVLMEAGGKVQEAEVLDFKTDGIEGGDQEALRGATDSYRGQMNIYRRALAQLYGLPLERARGTLVFLTPGRVVEVGDLAEGSQDEV